MYLNFYNSLWLQRLKNSKHLGLHSVDLQHGWMGFTHSASGSVCSKVKYVFWTGLELKIRKCGRGHCKFKKHPVLKITKKVKSNEFTRPF